MWDSSNSFDWHFWQLKTAAQIHTINERFLLVQRTASELSFERLHYFCSPCLSYISYPLAVLTFQFFVRIENL